MGAFALQLAGVAAAIFGGKADHVLAETGDCSGGGPLVAVEAASVSPDGPSAPLGDWNLPVSSQHPELVTPANVRLEVVNPSSTSSGGSRVWVHFSFPDPHAFGLPFTFQKAQLQWRVGSQTRTAEIDWSNRCSGPGRSLYPRQSWSASFDLSTADALLESPVFRLWGSRN